MVQLLSGNSVLCQILKKGRPNLCVVSFRRRIGREDGWRRHLKGSVVCHRSNYHMIQAAAVKRRMDPLRRQEGGICSSRQHQIGRGSDGRLAKDGQMPEHGQSPPKATFHDLLKFPSLANRRFRLSWLNHGHHRAAESHPKI